MEEDYKRLEENYKRLEEQCRFYEARCKTLEEENNALKEKCAAIDKEKKEKREMRSERAKEGWQTRRETKPAPEPTPPATIAKQEKHDKKASSDIGTRKEAKRFVKPTEVEVFEYMCTYTKGTLTNARDEAQKFMNYYEANGWMVGRHKMKDWKAAVRNWISNIGNYGSRQQQANEEGRRNFIAAIRNVEERERYEQEHGKEELPF